MVDNMNNVSSARIRTNRQNPKVTNGHQVYVDGSAARKLQSVPIKRERKEQLHDLINETGSKPTFQVSPMKLGYLMALALAIIAVGYVLVGYVELQSDITNRTNNISQMESKLNNARLSNDDKYTKIMSSIDLEEIKNIAINELGMRYAKEGQVVTYSGEGSDYVRQYMDIPGCE